MNAHRYEFTMEQIRQADELVLEQVRLSAGDVPDISERTAAALKNLHEPWALTMARAHDLPTRVANALRRLQRRGLALAGDKIDRRFVWRAT